MVAAATTELPLFEAQPLLPGKAAISSSINPDGSASSDQSSSSNVNSSVLAEVAVQHSSARFDGITSPMQQLRRSASTAKQQGSRRALIALRVVLLLVLATLSIMAARWCSTENLHWVVTLVQEDPSSTILLFCIAYSMGIMLMIPGMMLGIGAGAAYGFWTGSIVSWLSTVVGQTGAFLLGRYLLREPVAGLLARKFPNFSTIDHNIKQQGWKLALLLRLSPFIPYVVLNYGLGVTSVDLWTYSWVSALSALPYVLAFAYLGAASNNLYDALQGHETTQVGLDWTIAMAAVMLLSAVLLGWVCQRMLLQGANGDAQAPGGSSSSGHSSAGNGVAYHRAATGELQMEVLPTSTHSSAGPLDPPRSQSPAVLFPQRSSMGGALTVTSKRPSRAEDT